MNELLSERLLGDLSDLAKTPLLITLLAKMYVEQNGLPASRLELYEKLVEQHLDLRRNAFERLPATRVAPLDLLSAVVAGLRAKTTSAQFSVESWNEVCDSVLLRYKVSNRDHRKAWAAALREQGGLLVNSGKDHLAFAHQSFGEFLAGRGLLLDRPSVVSEQIRKRIADPFWREALTLGLAWCARRQPEQDFREILTSLLQQDPQLRLVESGALLATEAFRAGAIVRPWALQMTAGTLASAWGALPSEERLRPLAQTYLAALRQLEQLRRGTVEEIALSWLAGQNAIAAANAAELCQKLEVVSDAIANAVFRAGSFDSRTTGFALHRALRRLVSLNPAQPPSVRGLRLRQYLLDDQAACAKLSAAPDLLRAVWTLYGGFKDNGAFDAWNSYRELQSRSMRGFVGSRDIPVRDTLAALTAKGASFSPGSIHRESPLTDFVIEALGQTDPVAWFRTACELFTGEERTAAPRTELWRTVGRTWSAADETRRCHLRGHAFAALLALDGWSPALHDRMQAACQDRQLSHVIDAALAVARQDLQEAAISQIQALENQLAAADRTDPVAFESAILSLLWIARELDLPIPNPHPLWASLTAQETGGRLGSLVAAWMAWHAVGGITPLDTGNSKHLADGIIYALAVTWDTCFSGAKSFPRGAFALNRLLALPAWCNRFSHANPQVVFENKEAVRHAARLLPIFRDQNRFLFYLAYYYLADTASQSGIDISAELEGLLRYVNANDIAELREFINLLRQISPAKTPADAPRKPAVHAADALAEALDRIIEPNSSSVWRASIDAFRAAREIGQASTKEQAAMLIWKASLVPAQLLVPLYDKLVTELIDWGRVAVKHPHIAADLLDLYGPAGSFAMRPSPTPT